MALQANELRIGNMVNFNEDDTKFEVTEISRTGIGVRNSEEETWIELDQFSGIELTPEILEKCGFVVHEIGYKIENLNFFFIIYFYDSWKIDYEEKEKFGNGKCSLSGYWNFHQLQNLYHSLTGNELPVNL